MTASVHVLTVGARTPIGLTSRSAAAAVRAGISGMYEHPFMVDKYGAPMVVCRDPDLPADMVRGDRVREIALSAARECLTALAGPSPAGGMLPALIALPERDDRIDSDGLAAALSASLSPTAGRVRVECRRAGNAGGLACLKEAQDMIAGGAARACLVGGVDSSLDAETLEWLDGVEQLHSEETIWGSCPSEAAGFCLLASVEVAFRVGKGSVTRLLSAAVANEPNRIRTETVCLGEGLSTAFRGALEGLPAGRKVDHTICDMDGGPYRGNEFGFATLRSPGKFSDGGDFQTPADCWGDVGAASGPLFVALAATAAEKGYAPGPLTFLWASSDGGLRAAALLENVNRHKERPDAQP